jgi:hypothetical protein
MSMIGSALVCDHAGNDVSAIVNKSHVAQDENHQRDCFIAVSPSQFVVLHD